MKKFLVSLLTIIAFATPKMLAQDTIPHLGDSSFVSLITCGPGNEFYTTFGHSAIRICDSTLGIDVVYNYGTFNFGTNHFYLKFAQGRLNYSLSRGSYGAFLMEYAAEGRSVWEQRLNLTNQERNNLLVLLETNYLPEYRYYKYDFFRDNCATRIRDIINNSLSHRTYFVDSEPSTHKSYRDLLYTPTETNLLWWRFGVDLLLGQRCDKICTSTEYMFSPIEMMHQVDTTCIKAKNAQGQWYNTHQLLLSKKIEVLPETRTPLQPSINPTFIFWIIFLVILGLTLLGWSKHKKLGWLDAILFGVVGLVSLLLLFLWFGSDHYCTKWNWNLLWANPLFLYFAIRLRKSNKIVLYIGLACLLIVLIGFWWLPQSFNAAVFPIALTLFIRLIDKFKRIEI